MIPQNAITAWRNIAPWGSPDQVEHDLALSRAICELYNHPSVAQSIIFRGGTALHKLCFEYSGRFSEDLDFVQINPGPIGDTVDAIHECLDHWLGNPTWKQNHGRFILNYRFKTELEPIVYRKVKVEINTREHFSIQPIIKTPFNIENSWFQGQSNVLTYSVEELLATKLRALYQRKKGRDLYDIWHATHHIDNLNIDNVVNIFERYMLNANTKITRAEFEMNLFKKKNDIVFNQDIYPLLSADHKSKYHIEQAYDVVKNQYLVKLRGDPWEQAE